MYSFHSKIPSNIDLYREIGETQVNIFSINQGLFIFVTIFLLVQASGQILVSTALDVVVWCTKTFCQKVWEKCWFADASKQVLENGSTTQKLVHCLASKGCHKSWIWPRIHSCILVHAKSCNYLPPELCHEALNQLANKATQATGSNVSPLSITELDANSSSFEQASKRQKTGLGSEHQMGKEMGAFLAEGKKQWKEWVDRVLMKFVVCAGLLPTIFDTMEFKEFATILNSSWNPPSSSTIAGKLILEEAA